MANNTNTNVVQINFPKDMEIRKIKKKSKPKSNRKKKALEDVKEALQAYDQAVAEAGDKKIKIPQELAEMPQDIKQINTIKELEELLKSRDYTKAHDYKFLVEENKKLHKEVDELKRDNKQLALQITELYDRLRDSNY